MKFLILFCLFAAVSAMGKPPIHSNQPVVGAPVTKDPKEYEEKIWQYVNNVNDKHDGRNILIPVKVISAEEQYSQGPDTILEVIFGETTCAKSDSADLEISAANCKLLPNGKRSVWRVSDFFKFARQHIITVSKIRDVQQENESTSTLSSNGYTVSDNTETTNGKRNARDLKNVYEWH